MKKLLFTIVFLAICTQAHATLSYMNMGITKQAYQDGSGWHSDANYVTTGFHQGEGVAYQFNLAEDAVFGSFEGFMSQFEGIGQHQIVLYNSSELRYADVPGAEQEVPLHSLFSQSVTVTGDQADWHGVETQPMYLGRGTYWLGVEGGGPDGTYVMPGVRLGRSDQMATIHNPEPGTLALFGMGLLPLIRRRLYA